MIEVKRFVNILKKNKITFFTGVPDSVLKNFSTYLDKNKIRNIITANEGSAIALGAGYHLSSKKIAGIYFQNSGLGNAINPLISVANKSVYNIPLLLIIGWRGAPKIADEPQHKVKGKITRKLLNLLKVDHLILENESDLLKLDKKIKQSKNKIIACLIKDKTLKDKTLKDKTLVVKKKNRYINKTDFMKIFLKKIKKNSKIISTTGYTSRELYMLRKEKNFLNKGKDFYMVGGMGHAGMLSLGYSLYSKNETYCLDGDGSMLMHMGSLKNIGFDGKKNYKHILFNNNSHDSVGGQKTDAFKIDFKKLVKSLNFKNYYKINDKKKISPTLKKFLKNKGPGFLEIICERNFEKKLPRPKNLIKIKYNFTSDL